MIRRLQITFTEVPIAVDGKQLLQTVIDGDPLGLEQIDAFARELAAETGDPVVHFEVFWPWETEAMQTWDALAVDTRLIGTDRDLEARQTLPPYAELTPEQAAAIGVPHA